MNKAIIVGNNNFVYNYIRSSDKSVKDLIKMYNVSETTIRQVLSRKTWKHLKGKLKFPNKRNKLTLEQVNFIRNNKDNYSSTEFMNMFKVIRNTINLIIRNKRWKK